MTNLPLEVCAVSTPRHPGVALIASGSARRGFCDADRLGSAEVCAKVAIPGAKMRLASSTAARVSLMSVLGVMTSSLCVHGRRGLGSRSGVSDERRSLVDVRSLDVA